MKKTLSLVLALLLISGIINLPIKAYSYTYTGGVPKPTVSSDTTKSDENKEFKNDLTIFKVNSPSAKNTYIAGQTISLSITPEKFFFTVLPGGFTASNPNVIVMTIRRGDTIEKTFTVSYSGDDLGKTFSSTFTPTQEGAYNININYRGSNYGSYTIQVVKSTNNSTTTTSDTKTSVKKKTNPMTVTVKNVQVSYTTLKKKNVTVTAKKAFTLKKAKGKVTYKKVSGSKKITLSESGKITIKKNLKKGKYKLGIKITAAGNDAYKAKSKKVNVTITVK